MDHYWREFLTVAVAHLLAVVSPGPDFAVVLHQSLRHGRRVAIWTSIGVGSAIGLHVTYSLLGVGLILKSSPLAFATVKYIGVPSPVMTCLQRTNGNFQMRVDDVLQPGTLVIEACTNLAGWSPVFTNTTPTNVLFYTDLDASNAPTRFYRAFQFP